VHARRLAAADAVAALVHGTGHGNLPTPAEWDLLVNATPEHWSTRLTDLLDGVRPGAIVYDLVSNPPVTPLVQRAHEVGCLAIGGLEMLVAQAEAQAEWWHGTRPTPGLMMAAAAARAKGPTCV
jgi:shikimate dehydrogenase